MWSGIARLYKARCTSWPPRSAPDEIRARPPTTDTYSLPLPQEEVYFSLPYRGTNACLYARNHGVPVTEVAAALGLAAVQIERVYRDIEDRCLRPGPPRTTRSPTPRRCRSSC